VATALCRRRAAPATRCPALGRRSRRHCRRAAVQCRGAEFCSSLIVQCAPTGVEQGRGQRRRVPGHHDGAAISPRPPPARAPRVHISTVYVFDGCNNALHTGDDETGPLSVLRPLPARLAKPAVAAWRLPCTPPRTSGFASPRAKFFENGLRLAARSRTSASRRRPMGRATLRSILGRSRFSPHRRQQLLSTLDPRPLACV